MVPNKKKFSSRQEQYNYLRDKTYYWLYEKSSKYKAKHFTKKLEILIKDDVEINKTIPGAEYRCMIAHSNSDFETAIQEKKLQICLMQYVRNVSSVIKPDEFLWNIHILISILTESQRIKEAIFYLKEYKKLCSEFDIKFDLAYLLTELTNDQEE